MEQPLRCVRCGREITDGHCAACNTVYLTRCAVCGNSVEFAAEDFHGELHLSCLRCHNDSEFEVVPLSPDW